MCEVQITVEPTHSDCADIGFVIRPAIASNPIHRQQAEATATSLCGRFDDFGRPDIEPGWVVVPPPAKGVTWAVSHGALVEICDNGRDGYSHRNLTPLAGACVFCRGPLDAEADMPGGICSSCWDEMVADGRERFEGEDPLEASIEQMMEDGADEPDPAKASLIFEASAEKARKLAEDCSVVARELRKRACVDRNQRHEEEPFGAGTAGRPGYRPDPPQGLG